MKLGFATALIAAAACGGGSQNDIAPTATLAGAISGELTACSVAAIVDSTAGNYVFFICGNNTDLQVEFEVNTGAAPTTRTYASTDANALGTCSVVQRPVSAIWGAEADPLLHLGAYGLTLTSLGTKVTPLGIGDGSALSPVHGSFSCTASPVVGAAAGTVNVMATF